VNHLFPAEWKSNVDEEEEKNIQDEQASSSL
jgi:hypothetical protein